MSDNDPTATLRYQLAVEDLDRRFPRMVPVDDGAMCHRTYRDPAAPVEIKNAHGHAAIRYTPPAPQPVQFVNADGQVIAQVPAHPNDPLAPAGDGLARVVHRRTELANRRT